MVFISIIFVETGLVLIPNILKQLSKLSIILVPGKRGGKIIAQKDMNLMKKIRSLDVGRENVGNANLYMANKEDLSLVIMNESAKDSLKLGLNDALINL